MAFRAAARSFTFTSCFTPVGTTLSSANAGGQLSTKDKDDTAQDAVVLQTRFPPTQNIPTAESILSSTQQQKQYTTTCFSPQTKQPTMLKPQHYYRGQLQRLVAEAAKRDWDAFAQQQCYASRSFEHPNINVSSTPHHDCTTGTSSPAFLVGNHQNGAVPVHAVKSLHRTYWQHVMDDSIRCFDAQVASIKEKINTHSVSKQQQHDNEATRDLGLVGCDDDEDNEKTIQDAELQAYLTAIDRLSCRRVWCAPVSSSVANNKVAALVTEQKESLVDPMRSMWRLQAAQRRLLSSIPTGALFVSSSESVGGR